MLTVAFLNLSSVDLDMTQDEKYDLVLAVATGTMELDEFMDVFSRHLVDDA